MKKYFTILFFVFLFFGAGQLYGQFTAGFFTGYGMSSFEDTDDNAGYLPVGFQAGYSFSKLDFGTIFAGLDFNIAALPFTFDLNEQQTNKAVAQTKYRQMAFGFLFKMKFLKQNVNPFVRLGAGLYTGNIKLELTDYGKQQGYSLNMDEIKLKSGFGFNVGAGTDVQFGKAGAVFAEFVYHIVSRTPDVAGAKSSGYNNWAIHFGYQMMFGK